MSEKRITVIGAGVHARVVITLAGRLGYTVGELLDDDLALHGSQAHGHEIPGGCERLGPGTAAVIAIGGNALRRKIDAGQTGVEWKSLVHPSAVVGRGVAIGPGSVVMAGAVIQDGARIGRHVIVNTGAVIDHDCRIGDFCHVAPNATLTGGGSMDPGALLGAGATLVGPARLGEDAVAGAGAVVVRDIAPGVVVAGVPARPLR